MTEAMFSAMEQLLGVKPQDLYMNIFEMNSWGTNGRLK